MATTTTPTMDITPHGRHMAEHCGQLLQEWREIHGLSKYALSKATGLRQETITRIETGKAQMAALFTYLKACQLLTSPRDFATLTKGFYE